MVWNVATAIEAAIQILAKAVPEVGMGTVLNELLC
jgi:hypothetical protein